ncbi:MAG: MBL fold metallo-hydrolase [Clostridia bacterium]|nr:MBL fold metallo-hydrolase [Clostridia bacterium]
MVENIEFVKHNSIKIKGSKIIYIDPYKIEEAFNDADYVFCTHSHYDHFSPEDITKIMKNNTTIITVKDAKIDAEKLVNNVMIVEPNREYTIGDISFKTTYAYNENKQFHPKENGWVGFIINLDGMEYFVAGDTDNVPEIRNVKCDVALLPVGGTYTMNVEEAAGLANVIDAKAVVPTHYGVIVGGKEDGSKFEKLVSNKRVEIKY